MQYSTTAQHVWLGALRGKKRVMEIIYWLMLNVAWMGVSGKTGGEERFIINLTAPCVSKSAVEARDTG